MRQYSSSLAALLVMFVSPAAGLEPAKPPEFEAMLKSGKAILASRVAGETAEGFLFLRVEAGPAATGAIRVYAQPSHTLLLSAIDSRFEASAIGKQYMAKAAGDESKVVRRKTLPGSSINVQVPALPTTDQALSVYVFGTWGPGELPEEREVAEAHVSLERFSFATAVPPGAPVDDPIQCCSSTNCSMQCLDCGKAFWCCLLPNCCLIGCGAIDPQCTICSP